MSWKTRRNTGVDLPLTEREFYLVARALDEYATNLQDKNYELAREAGNLSGRIIDYYSPFSDAARR